MPSSAWKKKAIDDGVASARENRIPASRCRFIRSPVRRVDRWSRDLPPSGVDLLVLDQLRAGVGAQQLAEILTRLTPRRFVYVSCDPGSLATDLVALGSGAGRRAERRAAYEIESVFSF